MEEEESDLILSEFSRYKNEGCPEQAEFASLFHAYCQETKRRGKLDFDDMVLQCRDLFLQRPSVLDAWQQHFRYILVDEFQDINTIQYEVLKMLAAPQNNLFVVGDDDQSIYSFRGAKPEIMQQFLRDFPEAGKVELSVNYRSTPQIVAAAGQLIRENKIRMSKRIQAAKPSGEAVRFCGCADRAAQNERILREVKRDLKEGKSAAVILRINQDAGELAELFGRERIPFVRKENLKSPYRTEVAKDLMAYLSFALDGQKRSDFYRIMNRPVRYIARAALPEETVDLERLRRFYRDKPYMQPELRQLQIHIGRLRRMDLYAAVNYIRKGMGYDEWRRKKSRERGQNSEEWLEQAEWFQNQVRNFPNLEAFREHIRCFEQELKEREEKQAELSGPQVCLLTMHASKGLEYDSVYIPYCNEGVIPHKKSIHAAQIEEERRMLYVAMTRARERLMILWQKETETDSGRPAGSSGSRAGAKKEPGSPSRFLNDLGQSSESTSSSNSQLSRYSSKASATASYSSSSSM